jgi:hypothetical protein
MKQVFFLLIFAGFIFSCDRKDEKTIDSDIVGKWGLIEVLADPGDGSGTFHSVSSNKIIEFRANGTVSSNGSICDMSIEANESSNGTYSLADSTINSSNCSYSPMKITFEIQGSNLIINYPCIEACRAKYVKK